MHQSLKRYGIEGVYLVMNDIVLHEVATIKRCLKGINDICEGSSFPIVNNSMLH